MQNILSFVLVLGASALLFACDDAAGPTSAVQQAWATSIGEVSLKANPESKMKSGTCQVGTVAGLAVELCSFKDALSADASREQGLAQVGSNTGVALVRGSMLLIASDPNKIDVHGKKLNEVSKIFLDPGATLSAKDFGM